jgi:hypothetical protein
MTTLKSVHFKKTVQLCNPHSYIVSENLLIRFGKGNLSCLQCIEIVKEYFLSVYSIIFMLLSWYLAIFFEFFMDNC